MYIIGENIHIISQKVKEALENRDSKFFQHLAIKQVEAGAQALDINLGPRKKDGAEIFPWMVETIEAVVDVPISFDSTNLVGIEAGPKKNPQSPTDYQFNLRRTRTLGKSAAGSKTI